jgi:hypothetical protein
MNCKVASDGAEDSNVRTLAEALTAMNAIDKTYQSLVTCGHYGPAVTIRTHQANLTVPTDGQQLSQSRGANSTTGNRSARVPPCCWDCDQMGHLGGNPKCPNPKPGAPAATSSEATAGRPTSGLSGAESLAVSAQIQAKKAKFPENTSIPDGHTVMQNGKVVVSCCNKCKQFLKGLSMHSGATHSRRNSYANAAAPVAAPVAAVSAAPTQATMITSLESQLALARAGQLAGMLCLPVTAPPVATTPEKNSLDG